MAKILFLDTNATILQISYLSWYYLAFWRGIRFYTIMFFIKAIKLHTLHWAEFSKISLKSGLSYLGSIIFEVIKSHLLNSTATLYPILNSALLERCFIVASWFFKVVRKIFYFPILMF